MALNSIVLVNLRQRNVVEWVATMEARGDGEPASFAGERIVESFGQPQIHGRLLLDGDLRPELVGRHRGRASFVLGQITAGTAGTFTVGRNGRFEDYHGGHGLRSGAYIDWFTPEALARGVGWYMVQTYRHGTRVVGRFKVVRIFSERGVEVLKQRL
jgi:hypothetical protein